MPSISDIWKLFASISCIFLICCCLFFLLFIYFFNYFLHLNLIIIKVSSQNFLRTLLINLNFASIIDFVHCCNFAAFMLTYFFLAKSCVAFFRLKTFVATIFLHLMALICKVFINQLFSWLKKKSLGNLIAKL